MSVANQVKSGKGIEVGGKSYSVLFKPNLSLEARQEISETINKSMSGNDTDSYDMELIKEAMADDRLMVPETDAEILNAITQDYIEIQ